MSQFFSPRPSRPVAWRPLTAAEREFVWPLLEEACRRGRPMHDPWARFEGCLEAACSGRPWAEQRIPHVKPDSLHRAFRRWARRGLWVELVRRLALLPREHRLPGLEYFACRAARRAHRIIGMAGLAALRAIGLLSALRAPPHLLPDPALSERLHSEVLIPGAARLLEWPWRPARAQIRWWQRMLSLAKGPARWRRAWEPA